MTEVFAYKGKDIARITDGYVNSGVLRSWVSEGRVAAGGRSGGRGGPRTFSWPTVVKVAVMAELRKCGVPLDQAEEWAVEFFAGVDWFRKPSERDSDASRLLKAHFYYAIKPKTGTVVPIIAREAANTFGEVMARFGSSITIINMLEIVNAASAALAVESAPDD